MKDFTRKLIENLDAVFTMLTGGDFLTQYGCECGHGRRWHTRLKYSPDDRGPRGSVVAPRGGCEACECPCYRAVFPCGRCTHGIDFHRVEEVDGMPYWTVCIQCLCPKYQLPPPPPVKRGN